MGFVEIFQLAIFAFAGALHGVTGMAFPMIGTVALSLVMPLQKAVAVLALPTLVINLLTFLKNDNANNQSLVNQTVTLLKKYWLLVITSLIGSAIGVKLLLWLPVAWLYLVMSVVTLAYAIQGLLSVAGKVHHFQVSKSPLSMAIFGLLSGVIGGATNAMSSILLMFLFSYTQDNNEISKISNLCYAMGKLVQIYFLFHQFTQFTRKENFALVAITLLSVIFLYLGIHIRQKISQVWVKTLIYLVLLLLAIKIGYSAFKAF